MGRQKTVGIYIITSPSNRVYIGQSRDVKSRWNSYKSNLADKQPILNRSFIKHGVENHTFEILEKCCVEDLNSRERHWQDFYDVLKGGLNCILQSTDEVSSEYNEETRKRLSDSKSGSYNPNSLCVIDVINGIFYDSISEASSLLGINKHNLKDMLRGKNTNVTNLIKVVDFENGKLPETLFKYKIGRVKSINNDFLIIDYKTKKIIGDIKEVSEILNIKETTLRSYLNGVVFNKTNCIYVKDFNKGKTPNNITNVKRRNVVSINYITLQIYNNYEDVAKHFKVSTRYVYDFYKGLTKSKLPIVKIEEYSENFIYFFDNLTLPKK